MIVAPTSNAFSQQNGTRPGVQPRAPGYGASTSGAGTSGAGTTQPNTQAGNPPPNGQLNPQFNPQLNPQLNTPQAQAAAQEKLQQAVRDGQQWQMQGPNNGGQVIMQQPFPNLTADEQKMLDQVLAYWEQETSKIQRFNCEFSRWEYDSQAPGVAELARQIGSMEVPIAAGQGVIRFQKPDRGLFRTDTYLKMTGQLTADRRVELKKDANNFGEWVVCDGKNVWDYDRKVKVRTRLELPPEMQGLGIMNSPLPFLFGVKADEIKSRYWIRMISAGTENGRPVQDKYAIEAYPKYPVDAVNYHHVQIVLDREMFLPLLMVLFMPEWNDKGSNENGVVLEPRDKRMVYQFANRQTNATIFQKLSEAIWRQEFIPTDPGAGWTTNEIPYLPAQNTAGPASPGTGPFAPGPLAPGQGVPPGTPQGLPPAGAGAPQGQRTANPGLPASSNTPKSR
jgi:TIGR03009 family protein